MRMRIRGATGKMPGLKEQEKSDSSSNESTHPKSIDNKIEGEPVAINNAFF